MYRNIKKNTSKSQWLRSHLLLTISMICFFINPIILICQNGTSLLNAAVYEEEVNGDLNKAIQLYTQITEDKTNERSVTAEALYRLGMAHEKLGVQKATSYYRALVNNFSDQSILVEKAKVRLQRIHQKNGKGHSIVEASEKNNISKTLEISKVKRPNNAIKAISPDGKYFTIAHGGGNLAIYNRETDKKEILTPDPEEKFQGRTLGSRSISGKTVWSPDSKKIAYGWTRADVGDDLRIYDMETDEHRILCPYDENGTPHLLEWTADGKHILAESWNKKTNVFKILMVDVNTGDKTLIKELPTNKFRKQLVRASISPNNEYILYEDINEQRKTDLYLLSIDGTLNKRIFHSTVSHEQRPLWLDNGKSFLYFSDRSKSTSLWKATFDEDFNIEKNELVVEGLGTIYYHIGITNDQTYYYWSHIRIMDFYEAEIDFENNTIGQAKSIASKDLEQRIAPYWSNNGNKIVYNRITHNNADDRVEIRDMETGYEQKLEVNLEPHLYHAWGPVNWSPKDDKLLGTLWNIDLNPGVNIFNGIVPEIIEIDLNTESYSKVSSEGLFPKYYSENEIIFLRGKEIIKLDLETNDELVIYSSDELKIFPFAISPDRKFLAFIGRSKDSGKYNALTWISLDNNYTIHQFEVEDGISLFPAKVNWFPDSEHLLLSLFGNGSQQLYTFNILNRNLEKIGESVEPREKRYIGMHLHPSGKKFIFERKKNTVNLWALKNY